MAGFPGETDAEFEVTRRLINSVPSPICMFLTYSARPGTPAAGLPDQVPYTSPVTATASCASLVPRRSSPFMQSFVGKPLEAITLNVMHERAAMENSLRPLRTIFRSWT